MAGKEETRDLYLFWRHLDVPTRLHRSLPITKKDFAKTQDVTLETMRAWDKWELAQKLGDNLTLSGEVEKYLDTEGNFDMKKYLNTKKKELADAIHEASQKGNATAQRIEAQIIGELVEKSEQKVTLELSADEYARRNCEAERRLREQGYRVADVPEEHPLLSENLRKGKRRTKRNPSV